MKRNYLTIIMMIDDDGCGGGGGGDDDDDDNIYNNNKFDSKNNFVYVSIHLTSNCSAYWEHNK